MKSVETAFPTPPKTARSRLKNSVASSLLAVLVAGGSMLACAQEPSKDETPPPSPQAQAGPKVFSPGPVDIKSLPKNLFLDQKNFFTAPFHMNEKQWDWALPAVLAGTALIASDKTLEKHVPTSPTTVSRAGTASNAGVGVLAGAGAGLFLLGHLQNNDQKRETGLLSGEAAIGAFLDTEVFKYAAGRERPFTGSGTGRFFVSGDSFPSAHATVSFAIASVIAHEYPGILTQVLVYGVAGGVGAARWAGQKHFVSDVVIGSALGWYMGRQVFNSHSHYSDAEIARYGTFSKAEESDEGPALRKTRNMGSSYVPLDSWVYPALERLAALGYIQSASLSIRPWTRLECARLLAEAATSALDPQTPAEVQRLYASLSAEFGYESELMNGDRNLNAQFESAYARFLGVSGTPLTDNFHFGQTLLNDY